MDTQVLEQLQALSKQLPYEHFALAKESLEKAEQLAALRDLGVYISHQPLELPTELNGRRILSHQVTLYLRKESSEEDNSDATLIHELYADDQAPWYQPLLKKLEDPLEELLFGLSEDDVEEEEQVLGATDLVTTTLYRLPVTLYWLEQDEPVEGKHLFLSYDDEVVELDFPLTEQQCEEHDLRFYLN